jgi:hypothetical protein
MDWGSYQPKENLRGADNLPFGLFGFEMASLRSDARG